MRHRLSAFSCLLPLLTVAASAGAADLKGLRLVEDGQGTRAVLEVDSLDGYKIFTLANPDRLVLDLPRARLAPDFRAPGPNGAVASVRTGHPTPDTLRLVFDLGRPVRADTLVERDGATSRLTLSLVAPGAPKLAVSAVAPAAPPAAPSAQPRLPELASPAAAPILVSPMDQLTLAPGIAQAVPPPVVAVGKPQPQLQAPVEKPLPPLPAPAAKPAPATAAAHGAKTVRDVFGDGQRKLVVAIDAGHGGKDPGALGPSGVREKNITLAVARELARQINADPGMRAVLIRDTDSFVPLQQRYMRARSAQADLFISIHADAALNDSASGASVYVLSTRGASSQAARWLADKENAADLVGGVSLGHKDPHLAAVLLDLSQSATMRASDDVADAVLGALKNVGKAHKPRIERANFVVLRSPDVPSMLVETGFITNPGEERRLNDPAYRGKLAAAIASGVRKYFTEQAPPGSWYAARRGGGMEGGGGLVASTPE